MSACGLNYAHNPQYEAEEANQAEQGDADTEASKSIAVVTHAAEHPAHSEHHAERNANDMQSAEGHD